MFAAVLETVRNEFFAANQPVNSPVASAERFEPVSRILERCDEKSLEIARPVYTIGANS